MLAERMRRIEPSGIRRIFELMATMEDPINLSIGQAHYDPPPALVEAACRAMRDGKNRYTITQGLPELNAMVLDDVERRLGRRPESCLMTTGVSGGLMLTFLSLLDAGDEILLPDPYFVMYKHLAALCGATVRYYSTYPDRDGERFRVDLDQIDRLVNERTKIVFVNSPSNPTTSRLTGSCWMGRRTLRS
jgi:aspartate aminotransferase/aminotransferase